MQRLFLETPAPVIAGLVALGLIAVLVHRASKPRRGAALLAASILAAVGIGLLARFVVTPREHVESATAQLVEAVRAADAATLGSLLADQALFVADASLEGVGSVFPARLDKAQILAQVREHLAGDARVTHARIKDSTTRITGPGIAQTDLRVQVIFQNYGPHESWWRLDWRRTDAGLWRCWIIEPRGSP